MGWGARSQRDRAALGPPDLRRAGIRGGCVGEGVKAVIPATASAIVGMRLVFGQNPPRILEALRAHGARVAPPGVRVTLSSRGQADPMSFSTRGPGANAMLDALRETFSAEPLLGRMGGSIPVTADFAATVADDLVVFGPTSPSGWSSSTAPWRRCCAGSRATAGGRPEVVRHSVQSDSPIGKKSDPKWT